MKKYIFYVVALMTICTIGCRKIEMDGEPIIIEVPGGNDGGTNPVGKSVTLKGHVTKDTTLYAKDKNIISGFVYVDAGVTLTVEKGATVKGDYASSEASTLIIKRGAKIMAAGTQEAPIVFTSSSPTPQSGDWGGIVLLGKASINAKNGGAPALYIPEGGFNNAAGDGLAGWGDAVAPKAVDDDNSGVLQYVRIEYAGNAYLPNQEINSLTMAAVGSGTTIDHIQVSYAKDDAFEWFGGTVNCKYLIAYKTQDDDFDSDNGYSGSVQFGLIVRDSTIADVSKSESFESDNDGDGSDLTPQTKAVFCNISSFGPLATPNNVGNANYLGPAVQIRRNSSISIFNSAFVGWPVGILIDATKGKHTDLNIAAGTLQLSGIILASCKTPLDYTEAGTSTYSLAALTTWFKGNAKNKILTQNGVQDIYTRPFDYNSPDWIPFGNSAVVIPAASNNYFDDPILTARPFITKVDFLGGIAPSGPNAGWHKGWTKFN
ncbi:hypothetical protein [Niabella sp.]|uniref:hypothetical protein n=1 Tax=Niabella sp. TaxID=1962976 RepID=UPI0026092078|nr:hypothetical protein [Niabella sp.]